MHSTANRFQSVFGFFTTVAFVLGILTALSVVLHPADPVTRVDLTNIQVIKGRPHYYAAKREEYAQIKFDLDADLSSLFNWNTKQVFVYVFATYPSEQQPSSSTPPANATITTTESIIWDTIIPAPVSPYSVSSLKSRFFPSSSSSSKSKRSTSKTKKQKKTKDLVPGQLKLRNQKPKYQITDLSGHIAERENANLVVGWNVQPWIGALQWNAGSNIEKNLGGSFGSVFVPGTNVGGRSEAFDFPPLKGKTGASGSSSS